MELLTPREKALQLTVNICTAILYPESFCKTLSKIKDNPDKRAAFISEYLSFRIAYTKYLFSIYYAKGATEESETISSLVMTSFLPSCIDDAYRKRTIIYDRFYLQTHVSLYDNIRRSSSNLKDFVTESYKKIFSSAGLIVGKDLSFDEYSNFWQKFFIPDAFSFKELTINILNGKKVFRERISILEKIKRYMCLYPAKFWSLTLCAISLISLIFFVPYKTNIPVTYLKNHRSYENMNGAITYGTFTEKPKIKGEIKQYTDISYGRLGLQEIIIAVACAGGFILTPKRK